MTEAEAIVATVREPLLLLDVNANVRMASHAFYRTFQVKASDTDGRSLYELGNGQWNIAALRTMVHDVLTQDRAFEEFQVEHSFQHIGRRTMLVNARRLVSRGDNDATLALIAIEDITDRIEIERERARLLVALQQSNRALSEFATVAAHDLQEPLRKVLAFGERLQGRCENQLDDRASDYLARMLAASVRMRTLIEALLSYARVTDATQQPTAIQPNAVLTAVLADLEVEIQNTGATVVVGALPTVSANATQLRQIFQNLVGNALKFRREGTPPVIRVSAIIEAAPVPVWTATIEDNGIGFDNKHADRIFGLFQRLHGSSEYQGTGIGLALCRRIVEQNGGTITASGHIGHGARFVVSFPARAN